MRELNLPEHMALSVYLDGLPLEIKKVVWGSMPKTFMDAEKLARNAVKILKLEGHSLATMKNDSTLEQLTVTMADLLKKVSDMERRLNSNQQNNSRPDYVRQNAPGRNKRDYKGEPQCYACREYGHLARDCPRPQRPSNRQ